MKTKSLALQDNIMSLLKDKMNDEGFITSLSFSPREIYMIELMLLQQPGLIQDIGKQLTSVMKDGKIELISIPVIVLAIKDFINVRNLAMRRMDIKVEELVDFIENVLLILLKSNVIQTENNPLFEDILRVSVSLLSTTIDLHREIETTKCDCNCGWLRFWTA